MFRKNVWGIILGGMLIVEVGGQSTLAAVRVGCAFPPTRDYSLTPKEPRNKTPGTNQLSTAQPAAVQAPIHPLQKEAFTMEDSTQQTQRNASALLTGMTNIVVGNVDTKTLFPQNEADLESIDDVGRAQFISLANWILNVTKQELAGCLKIKILELDRNFVALVNRTWGEGIYESCQGILDTPLGCYDVPNKALGECSVQSILGTTPDFFPSSADTEFAKLVSIVVLVGPYVTVAVQGYVQELKGQIQSAVKKFTPEAIEESLADCNKEYIQSSVAHFEHWVELTRSLQDVVF